VDLYSGTARFKSRPSRWVFWLRILPYAKKIIYDVGYDICLLKMAFHSVAVVGKHIQN